MISTNELSAGAAVTAAPAGPKPSRAEVSRRNYAKKIKRLPGEPQARGFGSARWQMVLCTYVEAAKEMGVRKQAAHQLERTALWKIRTGLAGPVAVTNQERLAMLREAVAWAASQTEDVEKGARLVEERYEALYLLALQRALPVAPAGN